MSPLVRVPSGAPLPEGSHIVDEDAPPAPTDTGWRKAVVVCVGMLCMTVLAITGHLDEASGAAVGGPLAGYLGINLFGYRRR